MTSFLNYVMPLKQLLETMVDLYVFYTNDYRCLHAVPCQTFVAAWARARLICSESGGVV
jgi:hypothetical protein